MKRGGANFNTVQTHTSGFSLHSGQVMGGSQQSDVEHVRRQLEELQRELDQERNSTGKVIEQ